MQCIFEFEKNTFAIQTLLQIFLMLKLIINQFLVFWLIFKMFNSVRQYRVAGCIICNWVYLYQVMNKFI